MAAFTGGLKMSMMQRFWTGGIVCALLVHTLVCACMPSHWIHNTHGVDAVPSSVSADEWLRYTMSDLAHTLSHYMAHTQLPAVATGAVADTVDMGVSGFSVLLIMVAVMPLRIQRISALNISGWLKPLSVPFDQSPFHDIPILPPRAPFVV